MKKLVAAIVAGIFITGTAATTVSAEEHQVQNGESLWKIANKHNTTVEELIDINDLKSTVIHPKELLFINDTYSVKRGDTLNSIAREYNISADELIEWNDLKTDLIVIGQDLYIKGVNVDSEDAKPAETVAATEEAPVKAQNQSSQSTENEATVKSQEVAENTEQETEGKTISVSATAYTAGCEGCSGVTYTGVDLNKNPNAKVIAVDPNVIPLGSEVYVEGYGYATAADIGSAIKGNKIDLHVPTKGEAFEWGVKTVDVTIVD
ncbi:3D domain-containing protein [Oceanobacillus damuensis]|uniref:3D domain-containing protein n=1 Tax=Oceanobacillus damuensis TaxID=937928 RepID=UPI000834BF1F|nr:3D domain-containing protein [Oceanobacillus damuensis]